MRTASAFLGAGGAPKARGDRQPEEDRLHGHQVFQFFLKCSII